MMSTIMACLAASQSFCVKHLSITHAISVLQLQPYHTWFDKLNEVTYKSN